MSKIYEYLYMFSLHVHLIDIKYVHVETFNFIKYDVATRSTL